MTPSRALILHARRGARRGRGSAATDVDPVLLEVFANLFMAIAEEMGVTLQNTATSVNIKERLDFSCAIFDCEGALVANAPHMPVHLGSMGDCVTAIMRKHPHMRDGDVFVTNAPYDGGTHLPDITVVMPVFVDGARRFFVASRGHHADIGGITPGSMPPFSKDIAEEGMLFDGIAHGARRRVRRARGARGAGRRRMARAQSRAEHRRPEGAGRGLRERRGRPAPRLRRSTDSTSSTAYMRHVQDNAEESVRQVIGALKDGAFEMPMDGGADRSASRSRSTAPRARRASISPARARRRRTISTRRDR